MKRYTYIYSLTFNRITSQERRLSNILGSISHFESDMKEFLLWLTKAEVILMHHDEMTVANSACTDSEQQWNKLEHSFWVSRICDCHRTFHPQSFMDSWAWDICFFFFFFFCSKPRFVIHQYSQRPSFIISQSQHKTNL
jgi:hypothetical protein